MNHTAFLVVLALSLAACRNTANSPYEEGPSLIKPGPGASDASAQDPYPQPGTGTFEHLVADYESKDRVIWQKPDMVISLLGELSRQTVADIGAGTGYFSFRMVPKARKVIAIDIDARFIDFMDSIRVRLPEPYQARFETRLTPSDDPMLKPNEVQSVIMVNTYGYIGDRLGYLKKLLTGLSPGGQLLIIDFKKTPLPIGPDEQYKIAVRQVESELIQAGFAIAKTDNETLDYQYIILAKKPEQQ